MVSQQWGRTAASDEDANDQEEPPDRGWTVPCTERTTFAVAVAVGVLHAVDDALLDRQPGVPAGQHAWALLAAVVVALPAVVAFGRVRPGLRAGLAVVVGVVILTNGAMHVAHVWIDSLAASDLTGLLAAVAGAVIVGLGAVIPLRHRDEGACNRRRRWANRAGVVVVGGAGGDRMGSLRHAELLAAHGYGVLLYDARGSGRSEGSPNGWGWDWDKDVDGALTFLQQQRDIDPSRIGALGLSTGADVLIESAAENHHLAAVVADGSTSRSFDDAMEVGSVSDVPMLWTMFFSAEVLSGTAPGPPLKELVTEVSPTPLLLIAADSIPQERPLNRVYATGAREPTELWELPGVHHTAGIREREQEYERRVIGFFDRTLVHVS